MMTVTDTNVGTRVCLFTEGVPDFTDSIPGFIVGRDGAQFDAQGAALVTLYSGFYTVAELKELRDGLEEALRLIELRDPTVAALKAGQPVSVTAA